MGQSQFVHLSKPETTIGGMSHSSAQETEQHHATLYRTFKAGTCRPLDYRRDQLHQLARMCQENADAFADAIYKDVGKPKLEVFAFEIGGLVQRCLLCAEHLEEWTKPEPVDVPAWQKPWTPTVHRTPKGPVLIIACVPDFPISCFIFLSLVSPLREFGRPWNYPLILSLQALYAAIAAGCPAVIKPSEFAPAFAQLLAELIPKYLDPNAYAVVNGGVPETTKLLELRWAHIFYTGNGRVGRIVAAAAAKHLTPVSLELGGKSPVVVDAESCDLRIAARRIFYGKAANAGQTCVAPDYVLIPRSAQDALVSALREVAAERFPSGALASDSYGRIVNGAHFTRLTALLRRSRGKVVMGGETDEARLKIAPTVVTDVQDGDALMEEELFGPILPIVPIADIDEAIAFVNARDNPLAFYAFTSRPEIKQKLLDETLSGSLIFNDTFDQLSERGAVNELPFSGVGESGYGCQVMKYGFDGFTHVRSSLDLPNEIEPQLSVRYPPYTEENFKVMSAGVYLPIPPRSITKPRL
ncbi:aldehyde dehydrogenase [Phellopilus nigrolimitatus]|nr:aldehyde dehydrogenase [Phellopilus nigrolimitatus]